MEIWKDVEGEEGFYQVSNMGRIRSFKNGRWGRRNVPKLLSLIRLDNGYPTISSGANRTKRYIHGLVATHFIGERKPGMVVDHINKDRTDNRVGNLRWLSNEENASHKGEEHPMAKLNNHQVLRIRLMNEIASSLIQIEIGKIFGVSKDTISRILARKAWAHI